MPSIDDQLAGDLERPASVEGERRLDAAPRPAAREDVTVRQPQRGDDFIDDDERNLTVVRARQLDRIALLVGLDPRRDHTAGVAEQRHTGSPLPPFDLDSKHDPAGYGPREAGCFAASAGAGGSGPRPTRLTGRRRDGRLACCLMFARPPFVSPPRCG